MTNENPASTTTHEAPCNTQLTIVTNCVINPGQVVATPGALALIQQRCFDLLQLLTRHVHGDWGDCHPDDAALNNQALLDGSRLMSVYRLVSPDVLAVTPRERQQDLPTVWIITEAVSEDGNRASTCILLPGDY